MGSVGYKILRWTAKRQCKRHGHVGMVLYWGSLEKPPADYLLDNGRCKRCGEIRFPAEEAPRSRL